jgi:hypothetical protein
MTAAIGLLALSVGAIVLHLWLVRTDGRNQ